MTFNFALGLLLFLANFPLYFILASFMFADAADFWESLKSFVSIDLKRWHDFKILIWILLCFSLLLSEYNFIYKQYPHWVL